MEKRLSVQEYCDLFIKRISEVFQENGMGGSQFSFEIGQYFKVESEELVESIFGILIDTGLIKKEADFQSGSIMFQITGKGLDYAERGSKTGIIETYLTNSRMFTDNSVNIENNQGVVNTGSGNTITQHITINDTKKILEVLDKMKSLISDSQLDLEEKEEALLTIETVNNELKKKKPLLSIIKESLSNLANFATVASYAQSLLQNLKL